MSNSGYRLGYDNHFRNDEVNRKPSQDAIPSYDVPSIFQEAVETARIGIQRSLAGNEKVGDAVKPKLTIDLSHQSIDRVPEEVVEILKVDVERYNFVMELYLMILRLCSVGKQLLIRKTLYQASTGS